MKRLISFVMALTMVVTLAGCSTKKGTSGESQNTTSNQTTENEVGATDKASLGSSMKEVTLNIRIMNEFTNMDKIVAKYEELTKDDPVLSKVKLNFSYVTGADYKDKLKMAMTAQEDYDLMFCGSWQGLNDYMSQGLFADITNYFDNDNFPGLKAAFSKDYLDAAKMTVKNENGEYEKKLYSVPLTEYFEDLRGVSYREDLRQKYNIPEITDDESLRYYIDTVLANEPEMVGRSMWNGFFYADSARYSGAQNNVFWTDNTQPFGEETPFYVAISDDGTKVLNAVVMGDEQEEFDKMPANYNTDFIKAYQLARVSKWADVLDPNRGIEGAVEKDAAVRYCTLSEFYTQQKELTDKYSDAKLGFYVTEEAQRNMEPGAIISLMTTGNHLVIPEWSEKIDATMYFLDWMFGSKENHDLFAYGIEGEDWNAIGEDGIEIINTENSNHYSVPTYSLTSNPSFVRINKIYREDEKLSALFDYTLSPTTYTKSILSGFTFDTTNVATEIANISALSSELMTRFAIYGDETETKINDWHAAAEKVGLETVRQEMVRQIQEFLDIKNQVN